MASIMLSAVGQAAGAYVGGPAGAQMGSMLGARIGGAMQGPTKHHFEGARLETLAVQTSTYGRMIPIVFGTARIAGNVIWSLPIREVASTTTTRTGGKAGGGARASSSSTTYSYYVTLAIAVCEGELSRINRVWADSMLLDLSQGSYRLYKGTQDQLPDPLIESYEGVGSTPAYRGLAYVVIEDFPLGDFGNRIPNFTFEVTRKAQQGDVGGVTVESMVTSIMLLPGSGEFVYDTQGAYKITGATAGGGVVQSGYQVPMNLHTPEGKANVLVALDQLQETFPNLEWVGVVVNWFATSTDIASCEIWPGVEYQADVETTPQAWQVAGHTRATAHQIGNDAGKLRYGGTPDDNSILRLLDELRARGLKIFFYPMMLMDVAGKPWRGWLSGSASQVTNFFTKTHGYNAFITHYASLTAGKIDAFAIGTEMRDLTKITSSTGVFPAVAEMVALATTVKATLGSMVKVTYAADWSEYHHTDGGWYHLDPLWASAAIDLVGIDAYFPLADAVQSGYDIAAIQAGWTSGEGYDWYYTDAERTTQAPLGAAYAWKNIGWWWSHAHVNPNGATTAWIPGSKPIWLTEYGFPSVDGCANQPNVFIDSSSSMSAYPRFSRGRVDFMAQRVAIAATEAQWAGSSMITNKFLWAWDARPYPYWPDLSDVWGDGANWVTGHWVQGKLGGSHVAAMVEHLATRAGLSGAQIDTSALQMVLDGYVLHERVTARGAIEQLMRAYFFTLKESGEALVAVIRDATLDATVDADDCIEQKAGDQLVPYILTRQEDLVLPARQEVHYLNRLQRYETHVAAATRNTQSASDTAMLRVSLVLAEAHARAIAETTLADRWAERARVELQLPLAYAALEPNDILALVDGAMTHRIRLTQVQVGKPGMVKVRGVIDAAQAWDGYIVPTIGSDRSLKTPNPATRLEILDIPALPGDARDALTLRFAACGVAEGWKGATLTRVLGSGNDEVLLDFSRPATIGTALNALPACDGNVFDETNTLDIAVLGNTNIASATEQAVLDGANTAVLGGEVIQFVSATQLGGGVYRLSRLLRGRLGTEDKMTGHAIGERFVLLDAAVQALAIPTANYGQAWEVRATSFGDLLSSGTTATFQIQAESLKPLAPVQARAVLDGTTGNITIDWKRRTRIEGGLRDYIDVPLMEQTEIYTLRLMSGSTLLRSWQVTSPAVLYTAAQQSADFGSIPGSLSLVIYQHSALIGPGKPLVVTVPVVTLS